MSERYQAWLLRAVLLLVPFVIFFPTLEAGFLNWDDDVNVFENPHVQGLTGENLKWMFTDFGHAIRYKPLSWLGWAIVHECFGLNPFGFHLANVLIHGLNTLLLFEVMRRLVRLATGNHNEAGGFTNTVCIIGALLWALHPMRVEPVAWISGFGYQAAVTWLLAATILYLRSQEDSVPAMTRRTNYWLAVGCYGLATITYPIVLGFPALLIAIDFFPLRRFTSNDQLALWSDSARRVWLRKLPFILIAAGMVAFTLYGRYRFTDYWIKPAAMEDFGLGARTMQAAYVWAYYAWKPLLPTDLSPVYTTLIWNQPLDIPFVFSLVIVVGITALLIFRRRQWPAVLAIWIAHLGLLVPMLGLTERPHYTHDRYGIINGALWPLLLVTVLIRFRTRLTVRKWTPLVGLCLLILCGTMSFRQTRIWQNDIAFFTHMSASLGANQYRNLALMNLGEALMTADRNDEALAAFEAAAKRDVLWISPFDFQRLALSHGSALLNLGRWREAETKFREILQANPDHIPARNNLAISLWKTDRLNEAITELQSVINRNPDKPDGHLNLASLLIESGRPWEASPHLQKARELGADPRLVDAKETQIGAR